MTGYEQERWRRRIDEAMAIASGYSGAMEAQLVGGLLVAFTIDDAEARIVDRLDDIARYVNN